MMTAIEHIRRSVLQLSQAELARIASTSQATVSRWEAGELKPDISQMAAIRAEAKRRGIDWQDVWFFEAPGPTEDAA